MHTKTFAVHEDHDEESEKTCWRWLIKREKHVQSELRMQLGTLGCPIRRTETCTLELEARTSVPFAVGALTEPRCRQIETQQKRLTISCASYAQEEMFSTDDGRDGLVKNNDLFASGRCPLKIVRSSKECCWRSSRAAETVLRRHGIGGFVMGLVSGLDQLVREQQQDMWKPMFGRMPKE